MANPTDPTFLSGFDADAFRSAITSTMEMGLPELESDRITFRWKVEKSFATSDRIGNPYDLSAAPTSVVTHDDVQVPAAIEFVAVAIDGSSIGQFENSKVVATVMDIHFSEIDGADQALIGQSTYNVDFVEPPVGLGPVTIYRIWMTAIDES